MQRLRFFGTLILAVLMYIFYIVPPLLISPGEASSLSFSVFPFQALLSFIIFLTIYILSEHKKTSRFEYIFCFLTSFGLILTVQGVLQLVPHLFGIETKSSVEFSKPEGIEWLFLSLSFIFQGFNEEFLYRFFLPESLNFAVKKIFTGKNINISLLLAVLVEAISALIFAFSHRYLGFLAVVNAGLAHLILRFFYKKCERLEVTAAAHILYNFFSLLFLL